MVNKKIIYLFLISLIAAISLSPRLHLGFVPSTGRNIDIRIEDILLCIGLIFWLCYFFVSGKYKFQKPPLFWPILAWISFGLFSVLVNLLFRDVNLEITFFYFLKEIEFFLFYFLFFYCLKNIDSGKRLMKYWIIFSLVNVFWLFYVFIFNVRWSMEPYGPNAFIEPSGPFPSGGFFLMLFIFFLNLFIFYYSKLNISKIKKVALFVVCILPMVGVMWSGSMAATMGLLISIVVSLFLFFKGRLNFIVTMKIIILIAIMLGVVVAAVYVLPVPQKIISFKKVMFEYASGDSESRGGILREHLGMLIERPQYLVTGVGVFGEAHSQYMRVLLERGIMGLFLFFWLMWSILKISYNSFKDKNNLFKKGLTAGLFVATVSMLAMAIPNDVFMVVKPDEIYWFFTAMTMALIFVPVKAEQIVN